MFEETTTRTSSYVQTHDDNVKLKSETASVSAATGGVEVGGRLPRPKATLLTPDGGVLATRVHYETLNDGVFLLKATIVGAIGCLVLFVLLSLASANVDIKLGILAITTYPKLLFSSTVWSSTSVFAAIEVVWFLAYCLFSHIIRLHFNTADPPRDWDDRNGEWAVVELNIRANSKSPTANRPNDNGTTTAAAAVLGPLTTYNILHRRTTVLPENSNHPSNMYPEQPSENQMGHEGTQVVRFTSDDAVTTNASGNEQQYNYTTNISASSSASTRANFNSAGNNTVIDQTPQTTDNQTVTIDQQNIYYSPESQSGARYSIMDYENDSMYLDGEKRYSAFHSASDQWKLCVSPTMTHTNDSISIPVEVSLLTPDPGYIAWKRKKANKLALLNS